MELYANPLVGNARETTVTSVAHHIGGLASVWIFAGLFETSMHIIVVQNDEIQFAGICGGSIDDGNDEQRQNDA